MGRRKLTDEEKAVIKAKEDADREESNLKRSLQELREGFHSTSPTRTFKVGDRVDWSDNAVVEEVLDNGRIYLIRCKGMSSPAGCGERIWQRGVGTAGVRGIFARGVFICPDRNSRACLASS